MNRKLTALMFALAAATALTACDEPASKAADGDSQLTALERAAKESDAKGDDSARKRALKYRDPREGMKQTDPDSLRPWKQADAKQADAKQAKAEDAAPASGAENKDGN